MSSYKLYRNLLFRDWHKSFNKTPISNMGNNFQCNCPYGNNHNNPLSMDYRDPLNLREILNLKKGSKLLTLIDDNNTERIGYHELIEIKFQTNCIAFIFKENNLPKIFDVGYFQPSFDQKNRLNHSKKLQGIRYISIFSSAPYIPFGLGGDRNIYMNIFAHLANIKIEEVWKIFDELDNRPIPNDLKINCLDYLTKDKAIQP